MGIPFGAIPSMMVMSPADDVESKAMVKGAYKHQGPVYTRFSRYGAPVTYDPDNLTIKIGKGEVLKEGTDVAIIANGLLSCEAVKAAEALEAEEISAMVINT